MFLSTKKRLFPLTVVFLLSSCASNSGKDEVMEVPLSTQQEEAEIVKEKETSSREENSITENQNPKLLEQTKEQKSVNIQKNEESPLIKKLRREYHLVLISKYIKKIQVVYNDPNLDDFTNWAATFLNGTKKSIKLTLQVAFSDIPNSDVARWTMVDTFQIYEELMDNRIKKSL